MSLNKRHGIASYSTGSGNRIEINRLTREKRELCFSMCSLSKNGKFNQPCQGLQRLKVLKNIYSQTHSTLLHTHTETENERPEKIIFRRQKK